MQIYQAPGPQDLIQNGAVFPVLLFGPAGQIQTYAQVDTGSTICSVDSSLLNQVGAVPGQEEPVYTVEQNPVNLQEASDIRLSAG